MLKKYHVMHERRKIPRDKLRGVSVEHKRGGGMAAVTRRLDRFFARSLDIKANLAHI